MENSEEKLNDKNDSKEEENNELINKDKYKEENNDLINKDEEKEEENNELINKEEEKGIELQETIIKSDDIPQNTNNSKCIINKISSYIRAQYNRLKNNINNKLSFYYEEYNIHIILCLALFITGLLILKNALMSLPSSILKSQKLLTKISLGNICIILSSLFFYGSDTFLEVFKDCRNALTFIIYIIFDIAGFYLGDLNNYSKLDLVILPVDLIFIYASFSSLVFFLPGKEKIINFIDLINSYITKIKNIICCCCRCKKKEQIE